MEGNYGNNNKPKQRSKLTRWTQNLIEEMAFQLWGINVTHLHFYYSSKNNVWHSIKSDETKKGKKKLSRDKVINRMKLEDKCNFGNI